MAELIEAVREFWSEMYPHSEIPSDADIERCLAIDMSLDFGGTHAPAGFTKQRPLRIEGHEYVGGEFIPLAMAAKASPEIKAQLKVKDKRSGFHEIIRQKDGTYSSHDSKALPKQLHDRIQALKLPPAWNGVEVSADPNSALQAIGFDAKGREQRVYSADHVHKAAAAKFLRVKALVDELPQIDQRIRRTLHGPDTPAKEAAACLLLMRKTGFRIGSERDTKTSHQALGATTLQDTNVSVDGSKVRFDFIGKKGVRIQQEIDDAELAHVLAPRIRRKGKLFDIDDASVREYLHSIDGVFKPKDLRTVVAAETALAAIEKLPAPKNEKEFKKNRAEVGKVVSSKLGNTPTVALASYIPPEVFIPWQAKIGSKT